MSNIPRKLDSPVVKSTRPRLFQMSHHSHFARDWRRESFSRLRLHVANARVSYSKRCPCAAGDQLGQTNAAMEWRGVRRSRRKRVRMRHKRPIRSLDRVPIRRRNSCHYQIDQRPLLIRFHRRRFPLVRPRLFRPKKLAMESACPR